MTHTSGIQGDYFLGFGRGGDSIGRYVDSLSGIDLVHRPGQMWSSGAVPSATALGRAGSSSCRRR